MKIVTQSMKATMTKATTTGMSMVMGRVAPMAITKATKTGRTVTEV